MDEVISAPLVTPLKKIVHPKGDIYHVMKTSDPGYSGFGEAYFTTVHQGEVKGWKKHTRMQVNLVVPIGEVCFHVHDEVTGITTRHLLGPKHYCRLTVPPGYWIAFSGVSASLNLVLNVASIEHDPGEAINVPLDTYPLNMQA